MILATSTRRSLTSVGRASMAAVRRQFGARTSSARSVTVSGMAQPYHRLRDGCPCIAQAIHPLAQIPGPPSISAAPLNRCQPHSIVGHDPKLRDRQHRNAAAERPGGRGREAGPGRRDRRRGATTDADGRPGQPVPVRSAGGRRGGGRIGTNREQLAACEVMRRRLGPSGMRIRSRTARWKCERTPISADTDIGTGMISNSPVRSARRGVVLRFGRATE